MSPAADTAGLIFWLTVAIAGMAALAGYVRALMVDNAAKDARIGELEAWADGAWAWIEWQGRAFGRKRDPRTGRFVKAAEP